MAETLHALQVRQLVPVRWIEPTAELLSGAWKSGPAANSSHHTLQGNVLPNLFFYQKLPALASNSPVYPTQICSIIMRKCLAGSAPLYLKV